MSLIKKISQIKNLKSLQPDKRWETTTKFDLLSEIASQNRLMQAQRLDRMEKLDLFGSRFLNKLAPSFSKAVAAFLIVVMGTGVSYAAQASVPGQTLWPIKRSIEEAELTLTFSPIKETEIHIKHINKRLDEIDKILESENGTPERQEQKEKAIKQAVTHFTKDVVAVDSSLKIVREEKKPLEIVELVKKVTDATKEVDNNLKKKKEVASADQKISAALSSAQAANKVAKDTAVALALEVHEEVLAANYQGQADDSQNGMVNETTTSSFVSTGERTSNEDAESVKNLVKEIIASEIDETSQEVDTVKQKAEVVGTEDISALKKENADVNQASDELDSMDISNSEEVGLILDDAKVLLEDGFLRNAYEMIAQVKEKYQRAEVVLKEIEDAINSHNTLDGDLLEENADTATPNTDAEDVSQVKEEIGTDLKASSFKVESLIEIKETEINKEF